MFTSFSVTARDGMRLSAPGALNPAPDVHAAQSYDFGDFAFIQKSAGVVAIDAGTNPDRVSTASAGLRAVRRDPPGCPRGDVGPRAGAQVRGWPADSGQGAVVGVA
jgi:hypothetical protein